MNGLLFTSAQTLPKGTTLYWVHVVSNLMNGSLYYFSNDEDARAFCLESDTAMNYRGLQFIESGVNTRDLMDSY